MAGKQTECKVRSSWEFYSLMPQNAGFPSNFLTMIIYWANPETPTVFSLDTGDAQFELQAAHMFNKINCQFVLLFLPTVSSKGFKLYYFTGDLAGGFIL